VQWLILVILATTQEAEIGRMEAWG
jgi:hypothetical protein